VKSLAHALVKARPQDNAIKVASTSPMAEDPWQGIFWPEVYESSDDDDDEEEDESDDNDDEDEDSEMDDTDEEIWSEYGYGTGSDESV
jgi:hypothetical protein